MIKNNLDDIYQAIINDYDQKEYNKKGWLPLYNVSPSSKIAIIGQAPGLKTQEKNVLWDDLSGNRLREWLGVSREEFYDVENFAQIPMDFYFPGKAKTGDLPPRKQFSIKWHSQILENMHNLKLIILIGNYSQKYYLKNKAGKNLTETVHNYEKYLPMYLPLPHPSPLNVRWFVKNPWFEKDILPVLKKIVNNIIKEKE